MIDYHRGGEERDRQERREIFEAFEILDAYHRRTTPWKPAPLVLIACGHLLQLEQPIALDLATGIGAQHEALGRPRLAPHQHIAQGKARQSFLYVSAELTRLTLGIPARRATMAGRGRMLAPNA